VKHFTLKNILGVCIVEQRLLSNLYSNIRREQVVKSLIAKECHGSTTKNRIHRSYSTKRISGTRKGRIARRRGVAERYDCLLVDVFGANEAPSITTPATIPVQEEVEEVTSEVL
jgi:hypothetical protein